MQDARNRSFTVLSAADDLLMLCMADPSVKCIMAAFTYFSSVLGLKANLDKSHLVTGGIGNEIREHFLEMQDFTLVHFRSNLKYRTNSTVKFLLIG